MTDQQLVTYAFAAAHSPLNMLTLGKCRGVAVILCDLKHKLVESDEAGKREFMRRFGRSIPEIDDAIRRVLDMATVLKATGTQAAEAASERVHLARLRRDYVVLNEYGQRRAAHTGRTAEANRG